MQNVSNVFKAIFAQPNHEIEIKATIANVEYSKVDLYEARVTRSVLQHGTPEVGGAVSCQLDIDILPKGNIPRGAEVKLYLRLLSGNVASEWIPKGTFYVDTREVNFDNTRATLHCFDAMMKSEQVYKDITSFTTWPQSYSNVVGEIVTAMGLTLDSRTVLPNYSVEYPNELTCRDILGYISGSLGGNWTVTEENKLYLCPLYYNTSHSLLSTDSSTAILFGNAAVSFITESDLTGITNVGRDVEYYDKNGTQPAYTGVTIWYDDEHAFQAGTDTGKVLEVDCPWATQAMANNLLSLFNGIVYQAFTVAKAGLTPAAELGDMVAVDGNKLPILTLDVRMDGSYWPNISAPPEDEIDSEYPYENHEMRRQFDRAVKVGESYYGVTIDRQNGIEIISTDGQSTTTRAVLNSDEMAFYNADGTEALYFDPGSGKYKFVGDLQITGGSFNINNKFIVDTQGNLETAGSVTLTGNDVHIYSPEIIGSDIAVTGGTSGGHFSIYGKYANVVDLWGTIGAETTGSNAFAVFMRFNDFMSNTIVSEFVASSGGTRVSFYDGSNRGDLYIGYSNSVFGLYFRKNNGTPTRIV